MYCTAGHTGRFTAGNADSFGQCDECEDGTVDGPDENMVPLFADGERMLCAGCHPDNC